MSDVEDLIAELKASDPEFAEDFERGYQAFQLGAMLLLAREDAGMTQEQVAAKLRTKKSAISRMENHAEDIRLSTLQRYADALGCHLVLELRPKEEPMSATARKPRPVTRAARTKRMAAEGSSS